MTVTKALERVARKPLDQITKDETDAVVKRALRQEKTVDVAMFGSAI